jgi:glutathionyl-hydroquinone reductase
MVDKEEVRRSLEESILTQSIEDAIEDGERHMNEAVNANVAALPLDGNQEIWHAEIKEIYRCLQDMDAKIKEIYRILGKSGSS